MIGAATYQPVTPEVVKELQAVVGKKNLIFGDAELLRSYSHDEVAGPEYARMPEVVVKPATAREVSQILKIANRHRVPVTPRGGGTGLSCGAVPWAASGSRTSRATTSSTSSSARRGPWASSRRSSCGSCPGLRPRRSS